MIKGRVLLAVDEQPAPYANVVVVGQPYGAATDEDGYYLIDGLPAGTYDLDVSMIGYRRERVNDVHVEQNRETRINVKLVESAIQLNEVVVTGVLSKHLLKDTPVITEVISKRDMATIGSSDFTEIMRVQTGVEVGSGVGQTQIARLQGLSKNQVLILVDGERTTGKVDDAIDLGQFPVNMIDRVEIVKGPMSAVYGSEALGGVINIITKDPKRSPLFHVGATGGSYGRQDYEASAAKSFGDVFGENTSLGLLVNTGWNKFFGVDYDPHDGVMELPEYDRKNAELKTVANFGRKLAVDVRGSYYKDRINWQAGKTGVGVGTLYYTDFGTNEKVTGTAVADYRFSPLTSLKLSAHVSKNDHGSWEETNTGYQVRNSLTGEQVATYRAQFTTSPYTTSLLTVGLERNDESARSQRIEGGTRTINNNVLFAEDEWTMSRFTFSLGGRYSDNSVYGRFFAPKVSLLYKATERLTLRGSYGRGFRAPSLLELFIDYPNTSVGYQVIGNPDLGPETSNGFNLGMDYSRGDLVWFRANAYYNDVRNMIDYYLTSTSPMVTYSYHNILGAVTKGIDVDVDFHPLSWMVFGIGYNYISAKDDHGNILPFHSPHTLNGKLILTWAPQKLTAALRGRWYDRKLVIDEQTNVNSVGGGASEFYLGAYGIYDVKVSKVLLDGLDVSAGINNIGDTRSYPFGQIKGREFYAGASYDLK